jgi:HD-GYP domain-containing protein (c-di-GMP phosphodiesterase class II)
VRDLATNLKLLNQAGRAMHMERDLDRLLDRILGLVDDVFRVDTCAVLLQDEDGVMRIARARGYPEEFVQDYRGAPGCGITGWVAEHGEALFVPDVQTDPRYVSAVSGAVAEIAAPLRLNGHIIGVLDAALRRRDAFDATDLELFSAFAVNAATAIHNARLLDQLERRAADLALLTRCGRELSASLDLEVVLCRILELAHDALKFERCAVLLKDEAQEVLTVSATHGYSAELTRDLRIRAGEGVTGAVLRSGQPELVVDVTKDARYIPVSLEAGSEMAIPLVLERRIIGVLDAESSHPGAFDAYHLELFSAFGLMAAVAIQNARFHRRLESKVRRLALLNQCSRALALTLDPDDLLQEVLRLLDEALHFERCAVLLTSKDGQKLTVRATRGYRPEVTSLNLGEGITGLVAKTGQPRLVLDVTREPGYIQGMSGGRCEMAAPLMTRGRMIGVLDVESHRPGAFAEQDLELLTTFAATAASAIHNAELYRELDQANASLRHNLVEITRMNRELSDFGSQISSTNRDLERRVRELLILQEASRTITSSLDLDETLQAIVRMAREIVRSSTSAIKLLDEESREFRIHTVDGVDAVAGDDDMRSIVSVPLQIGERLIGFFELGSLKSGAFSDEDRRMIETLASQAAIAIENARLFESTQRTYFEAIRSLAFALEARDSYTRGHSERATALALKLAQALGLSAPERQIIANAGVLHDIGKIGVADAILNKPFLLTAEDRKVIESHPLFGGTILAPLRFLDDVKVLVRHHHEHFDGSGYPEGLRGEAIPLGARIINVCDAYDAMTSDRPYRKALSHEDAIAEIRAKTGTQFDPTIVAVFLALSEIEHPHARLGGTSSVDCVSRSA